MVAGGSRLRSRRCVGRGVRAGEGGDSQTGRVGGRGKGEGAGAGGGKGKKGRGLVSEGGGEGGGEGEDRREGGERRRGRGEEEQGGRRRGGGEEGGRRRRGGGGEGQRERRRGGRREGGRGGGGGGGGRRGEGGGGRGMGGERVRLAVVDRGDDGECILNDRASRNAMTLRALRIIVPTPPRADRQRTPAWFRRSSALAPPRSASHVPSGARSARVARGGRHGRAGRTARSRSVRCPGRAPRSRAAFHELHRSACSVEAKHRNVIFGGFERDQPEGSSRDVTAKALMEQ